MQNGYPLMLVEDDETDVLCFERALQKSEIHKRLVVCRNGEEALEYLNQEGSYKDSKDWVMPNMILLDLNMPRMDGFELLDHLNRDERFRRIPVVIFTSSSYQKDLAKGFDKKAAGYIVKPMDYNDYSKILKILDDYWSLSLLPPVN